MTNDLDVIRRDFIEGVTTAMLCTDDIKKQLLLEGGGFTRIYAPDGQLMHTPLPETEEGIAYADVDLGMIALAKAAADPAGHYSRPDVTRLLLNKTPGDRVVVKFGRSGARTVARDSEDAPAVSAANGELPARFDEVEEVG